MNERTVEQKVRDIGVVAILRRTEKSLAIETVEALVAGGVDVVEVTMDSAGVLEMIADLAREFYPQVVVGAGTVRTIDAAREALLAGAQFIVAPDFNPELVRWCRSMHRVIVPGAFSPTEVAQAWEAGASMVKVFPAGSVGPAYIRDLKGPLRHIPLVPTGGISAENVGEFIRAGAEAVGAGNSLVGREQVANREFGALTDTARRFVENIRQARGK